MQINRSDSRVDMFGNLLLDYQDSPTMEFRKLSNHQSVMDIELDNLARNLPGSVVENDLVEFRELFTKFVTETGPSVVWDRIEKLSPEAIRSYSSLSHPTDNDEIKSLLSRLVVVKLNGAQATPIGCNGPTSAIPVRNDLTALDITVQQIEHLNRTYDADVPLVLMNSFLTHEDTEKVVRKYSGCRVEILTFCQSKYPRIHKESLAPLPTSGYSMDQAWYPPGHGDFYNSFTRSGLLDKFVDDGKEVCFISNMDNLGAGVDVSILKMMLSSKHEFLMEVTEKTRADVKGGTLISYDGRPRLLELAQVPTEQLEDFMSVKKFNVFNTNNLWINMSAIQRVVREKALDMEVIVNPITLEQDGTNVYQLVTAIGAAMKCFENAVGINVPRSRFLPVKKTSDLLLVMSNLYCQDKGDLVMSPKRMFPSTPLVKLGKHFKNLSEFLKRFGSIPDLIELDHLTVSGDVTFGRGVSLKGTVIIIANHGDRIDIPPGAVIENKIVSGNLRIMDH